MDYIYTPLRTDDTIRLVTILPGRLDDDIQVKIWQLPLELVERSIPEQDVTLDVIELQGTLLKGWSVDRTLHDRILFTYSSSGDAPDWTSWDHPNDAFDRSLYQPPKSAIVFGQKYEALSYTWGSEGHGDFIYSGTSRLSVRTNLASALRHLRYEDRERTMWIDAVCINQNDNEERSKQVARMADIFEFANRVIVWLGPEAEDSRVAIDNLRYLGNQVEPISLGLVDFLPAPGAQEKDFWMANAPPFMSPSVWVALERLLSRGWFYRHWVVQEICLAREARLVCGSDHIDLAVLQKAILALVKNSHLPVVFPQPVLAVPWNLLFAALAKGNILIGTIFELLAGRFCSDPRDYVYGLLGLLPETFRDKIPVDYNLPTRTVYEKTTIAHIKHVQRLELLEGCCLESRAVKNMPSWVPDFSRQRPPINTPLAAFAAGFSRCWVDFVSDGSSSILKATGVRCEIVARASKLIPRDFEDAACVLRDCTPRDLDSAPPYVNGETFRSAYIKALTFGAVGISSDCYNSWMKHEDPTRSVLEEKYALNTLQNRRYLVTKGGFIGIGPPGTDNGMSWVNGLPISVYPQFAPLTPAF